MKIAYCHLTSKGPYSQSRPIQSSKKDKEGADDFEKRTWKERMTLNEDGVVCIPAMGLKQALADAAVFNSRKIPGKRNATFSKHFKSGLMVLENIPLGVMGSEVNGEWVYCNADGKRGSGTRVWRCFPVVPSWSAVAPVHVFDDTITEDVFEDYLKEAGMFIGLGRFRPQNGGIYGRFGVDKIEWETV